MTIVATLSDGNTATIERDHRGFRIISSSYSWINPPEGKAFYLDGSCLQGGKIAVWEYSADDTGHPVGRGVLVTSGRTIANHRSV